MINLNGKKQIFIITLLLLIDQGVKLIIFNKFNHLMNVCTPVNVFLKIHPLFNKKTNWLNDTWDLGITRKAYIICALAALMFLIYLNFYYKFEIYNGSKIKTNSIILVSIGIAGMLGALCDQFFWGYTLDYIEMGPWIFDLKDVYVVIGLLGIAVYELKYKSKGIDMIKKVPEVLRFSFKKQG